MQLFSLIKQSYANIFTKTKRAPDGPLFHLQYYLLKDNNINAEVIAYEPISSLIWPFGISKKFRKVGGCLQGVCPRQRVTAEQSDQVGGLRSARGARAPMENFASVAS